MKKLSSKESQGDTLTVARNLSPRINVMAETSIWSMSGLVIMEAVMKYVLFSLESRLVASISCISALDGISMLSCVWACSISWKVGEFRSTQMLSLEKFPAYQQKLPAIGPLIYEWRVSCDLPENKTWLDEKNHFRLYQIEKMGWIKEVKAPIV